MTLATRPVLPTDCQHTPLGGFCDVWRNELVFPRLGCAIAPAEAVTGTEAYLCDAHALWLREKRLFVVIDYGLRWSFVSDGSGLPPDAPLMLEPVPRPQPCFVATGRHGWMTRSSGWAKRLGQSRSVETPFGGAL